MEIISIQYSIDAAYKFHMHVRTPLHRSCPRRQNRVADSVYGREEAGGDGIGGMQLWLLYSPCFR